MKRWIILNDLGQLEVVCTSGFEPVGVLCPCRDEWVLDELSYDPETKLVFIDPEKVRIKREAELKDKWEEKKNREWREFKHKVRAALPRLRDAVVAFAIGLFLGKIL